MVIRISLVLPLIAAAAACKPIDSPLPDEASATAMETGSDESGDPTTTTTTGDDPNETEPDTTTGDITTTEAPTTSGTTEAPVPICGDGHVDADQGEECDDGPSNDNEGECTEICRLAECGDGYVQRGEECDLGGENDNEGECTNLCTVATCGDGYIQEGEACDKGKDNDANKNGGCHPETCQIVMTCGDGMLQEDEECDGSAQADIAKACTDCYFERRLVFATSEVFAGDFQGIAKADSKCKALAAAAEVKNPGNFVAWISLPGDSIASRIEHLPFKYVRTDQVLVANGWDELVKGKLSAPIELDESGAIASGTSAFAWTGTLPNGEAAAADPCLGWTTVMLGKTGGVGTLSATGGEWTSSMAIPCSAKAHLYCVET